MKNTRLKHPWNCSSNAGNTISCCCPYCAAARWQQHNKRVLKGFGVGVRPSASYTRLVPQNVRSVLWRRFSRAHTCCPHVNPGGSTHWLGAAGWKSGAGWLDQRGVHYQGNLPWVHCGFFLKKILPATDHQPWVGTRTPLPTPGRPVPACGMGPKGPQ